jgi:hypothetical protein
MQYLSVKTEIKFSLSIFAGIAMSFGLCHAQNTTITESNAAIFRMVNIWCATSFEHDYYDVRHRVGAVIPEVLPTSQDPNGHWGEPGNGLQLSLRFRPEEFLRGEPVQAVVIVRNLYPTAQTLVRTNGPGYEHGASFLVRFGTNGPLALRPEEIGRFKINKTLSGLDLGNSYPTPFSGLVSWEVPKQSEELIAVNLNDFFDLSQTGSYSVQAVFPVFGSHNHTDRKDVVSEKVSFRIVKELSPGAIQAKNAWNQKLEDLQRQFDQLRRDGQPAVHP